ncbi:hypothetical protein ACEXQD_17260 [Herbiconiux sp. P15]|uniref:hypothetical protein n=1 Tax=Herbiconiux liukaitaii TaxID=3342799 RepID=UPI0035B9FFF9
MPRGSTVGRPLRSTEYEITFGTREAEKGWSDLRATARNSAVEAWEFLTSTPTAAGAGCYRLRGDLGIVVVEGVNCERWQYKARGGARIWYAVVPASKVAGRVILERVTTGHPNETVKVHR